MKARVRVRQNGTRGIIPFPIPRRPDGDTDDPRWQRVEALYREIARLEPEFFANRHDAHGRFRLLLEQTFCHYRAPMLIQTWSVDDRVRVATLCQQLQHDAHEREREARRAREAAGTQTWYDRDFGPHGTASEELEDLVITLQRRVDDCRRDRERQTRGGAR